MRPALFFLLATFLSWQALAQEKPEDWPEGSAMRTGLELAEKRDHSEALLDAKHRKLIALVKQSQSTPDERLIAALEAQQKAWLEYRSAECELEGSLSGAGGSWPSTYAVRCDVNLTDRRLRTVSSAIRCIEKIPASDRWVDQNRCLYQLGPLSLGK